MKTETFFIIASDTSRNGTRGLRPYVTWNCANKIIEFAQIELNRGGVSLEDLAGIKWVEDDSGNFNPTYELSGNEIFYLSVEALGDDGRLYLVFSTDEAGGG